ncbi:MAG: broad specificity phosphatase PhoE [Planctomycetota bacterium]|jgi:broad specificity phosphatase PhoE
MRLIPPPPTTHKEEARRTASPSTGSGSLLWLFRHGAVAEEFAGRAYGNADVPLSSESEWQTRRLAKSIAAAAQQEATGEMADQRGWRNSLIASSPLQRSLQLGQACADALGQELTVDARLAELYRGTWQGLPVPEYMSRWHEQEESYWKDPWTWSGHEGESEQMLAERTWPALLELLAVAAGRTLIVTCHRNVIRSLVANALGLPPGRSHGLLVDPTHGVLLLDAPRAWQLMRSNIGADEL